MRFCLCVCLSVCPEPQKLSSSEETVPAIVREGSPGGRSKLLKKEQADFTLTLNGKHIPVVEVTKFLGLVFDRKLTFVPHLQYLRTKCLKALNLLRVVAHASWGGDQQTLLNLCRSLIRSYMYMVGQEIFI